ncbi:MAG TPA: hypothetical protein VFZ62_01180 [Candidatus Saccharimonadales bacterium]
MFDISDEKYEELRLILEKQNGRTYTFEDAKEIGDGLIDFYALLKQLEEGERNVDATEQGHKRQC